MGGAGDCALLKGRVLSRRFGAEGRPFPPTRTTQYSALRSHSRSVNKLCPCPRGVFVWDICGAPLCGTGRARRQRPPAASWTVTADLVGRNHGNHTRVHGDTLLGLPVVENLPIPVIREHKRRLELPKSDARKDTCVIGTYVRQSPVTPCIPPWLSVARLALLSVCGDTVRLDLDALRSHAP